MIPNEEEVLIALWNKIKKVRINLQLSQWELAKKTSIDRSYISMVESGKTNITFLKLKRIEKALGTTFNH